MLSTAMLLVILILLLLYLSARKPKGYPPGPRWWPILGSAMEVARLRQQTGYLFKTCSALCKKYGPVVGLKIGTDRIVVLNDYESIRTMLTDEDCDGRPIGPVYETRTFGARRGLIVVDENLWVEQRRFVLRHLREFGLGRNSMNTIIEEEAHKLVDHFKTLFENEYNSRVNDAEICQNNNVCSDGQIYKLIKKNDAYISKSELSDKYSPKEKLLKAADMYVNADEYVEVRRMSQSSGIIVSMDDAFGVTVLNTLWRMMAGKRLSIARSYDVSKEQIYHEESLGRKSLHIIMMHRLCTMSREDFVLFGKDTRSSLAYLYLARDKTLSLDSKTAVFNPDDKELTYLQRILTKLLREIDMIGAPFGHFPILRFIAPELSGYKSFLETHQQLWKFLKDELNNHKNSFNPESPRDLMDVYLTVLKSENYSDTFSEAQLLAICVDLFMAGSETTSKALSFCFLYLVLFPDVQKKAQEEIDRVIGRSRLPTLADRPRMTYMNAIVLESLRMFMGRTLNVPHRALRDTSILGHKIPKDTMLVVNFNRILMDESWGDPEDFRPERFIDESGNISVPPTHFPFSMGRHRCMGENLARSNIFVIATALLQAFSFSVVPGEKKPSRQDFVDGVTAGPKPYRVLVSLRT